MKFQISTFDVESVDVCEIVGWTTAGKQLGLFCTVISGRLVTEKYRIPSTSQIKNGAQFVT